MGLVRKVADIPVKGYKSIRKKAGGFSERKSQKMKDAGHPYHAFGWDVGAYALEPVVATQVVGHGVSYLAAVPQWGYDRVTEAMVWVGEIFTDLDHSAYWIEGQPISDFVETWISNPLLQYGLLASLGVGVVRAIIKTPKTPGGMARSGGKSVRGFNNDVREGRRLAKLPRNSLDDDPDFK